MQRSMIFLQRIQPKAGRVSAEGITLFYAIARNRGIYFLDSHKFANIKLRFWNYNYNIASRYIF